AAEAGHPARLLLSRREPVEVRRRDIVVKTEAEATGAGPNRLLGEYGVVAEVVNPAAAVLLLDLEAEQAVLAGLDPYAAVDETFLLPLVVERRDVALDKASRGVAERLVIFGVELFAHRVRIRFGFSP